MSLVERIQTLCSSKDTTLIGLEREIGLGRGTIRNWDKNSPSVDKLQKVAQYFNVSTDYLLHGFDRSNFSLYANIARFRRSIKEFAEDTGIDEFYLARLCASIVFEQPPIEIVEQIANHNQNNWVINRESIFRAAGYEPTPEPFDQSGHDVTFRDRQEVYGQELDLITRFRKLSPISQTTLLTLLDNLEMIDKTQKEQSAQKEVG